MPKTTDFEIALKHNFLTSFNKLRHLIGKAFARLFPETMKRRQEKVQHAAVVAREIAFAREKIQAGEFECIKHVKASFWKRNYNRENVTNFSFVEMKGRSQWRDIEKAIVMGQRNRQTGRWDDMDDSLSLVRRNRDAKVPRCSGWSCSERDYKECVLVTSMSTVC